MSIPNTLVFVRHGESEGNVVSKEDLSFKDKPNHRFSLTEKGRQQAIKAGEFLRKSGMIFDAYFVSTFLRTQETMSLMFPDARPRIDSRLNELWRGIWHTMSLSQVWELYPEERQIKEREGWYHYMPPGGQGCQDIDLMFCSFLQDIALNYSGANILIAAHGNWQILLSRFLYNLPIEEAERRYKEDKYKNGSITVHSGIGFDWTNEMDNFVPE